MKGIDPLFFFLKERRDWRVTWTNFKSAQGRKRFMTMGNTITWAAEKFPRDRGRTHRSEKKSIGNPRIRVRRWCTQNTSCDEKKDICSILLAHTFIFFVSCCTSIPENSAKNFLFLQNNSSIRTSLSVGGGGESTNFALLSQIHLCVFGSTTWHQNSSDERTAYLGAIIDSFISLRRA